ncbi:unnamed protein product [Haemonchus placei]|uniref:Histone H4 n=1 Tax=Haemonchus placei TaxID=6290 RepID=A0A0N4X5V6_HAEPC|nr:unnamed protein product [Haemonchus placei]
MSGRDKPPKDSPSSSSTPSRRRSESTISLPPHDHHRPVTRQSLRNQRPVLIVPPELVQRGKRTVKVHEISRASIRKLAVRAGVQRLRKDVYEESLQFLETFLDDIIYDIIQYCTHAKRKVIHVEDVKNALKRRGLCVYGFDD